MKKQFRIALVMLVGFTILTGIVYPAFVTLAARGIFPNQSRGSLIRQNEKFVGSELIGQPFQDPKYFWGRPSATPTYPYNASASNAANVGPTNPALQDAVKQRIEVLHAVDPDNHDSIPVDLVTTSASGLDPHISPAAAYFQVARVARLRGLDVARVRALVDTHIQTPIWGFLGERRVNVLRLNLALDELAKAQAS
mgnify:CR=1 FL=1